MFLKKDSSFQVRGFLQPAALCFLVIPLLFIATILALRFGMRQSDHASGEEILYYYLDIYQQQGRMGLQKKFSAKVHDRSIFLRLQTENDQLLLVADSSGNRSSRLPDFSDLSDQLTGTWVQLNRQNQEYWTIALARLHNGSTLQVGIKTTDTVSLYNDLKRLLAAVWLLSCPIALLPAWFIAQEHKKEFTRLSKAIQETDPAIGGPGTEKSKLPPGKKGLLLAVTRLNQRHQLLTRQLQDTMDNVAHDLRTPVTRLRTIAEYGLQEENDPGQLRERLIDCLEESDRLLSMLNTMLNVAEAEAKSMALDLRNSDLRTSIEEVRELYSILAEEKNCAITVQESGPVVALVDANRIGQVWANLVDNAIKYGASEVLITLEQDRDQAVVSIRDNGMGISETEIDQIWTRLFRGDRSRSQPGLGLGLTLASAIVKAHSGSIEVHSELNRGTTFTIKLPAIMQQQ